MSMRALLVFRDAPFFHARCLRPYDARIGRTRHAAASLRRSKNASPNSIKKWRRPMTKIAYEDFERQIVQHHIIKGNVYENGAALVERANRWIAENGIDVLNVESLSTFGAGDDTSVSHWYSGIRVWYRTD
jgi:hypothetical protein